MPIKNILAACSGDAEGRSGLELALFMQKKYAAHLTGVVWHGPSLIESRYQAYMTDDILALLHARDAAAVAEMRADFEARVAGRGDPARAHFLDLGGMTDVTLADAARGFDLVVMPRPSPELGRAHFSARPDVVALRSGRPVIVVPPDYRATELGAHALVAWDGRRAAARALGDAPARHREWFARETAPARRPRRRSRFRARNQCDVGRVVDRGPTYVALRQPPDGVEVVGHSHHRNRPARDAPARAPRRRP